MVANSERQKGPQGIGVRPFAGSRFVTALNSGRLSITRVLLLEGEAYVAQLPSDQNHRPKVFCPFCGELGKYRHYSKQHGIAHFAHATADDCSASALESALHRRAKSALCEGLAQLRSLKKPVTVNISCLRCANKVAVPLLREDDWDSESEEVPFLQYRLDVAAQHKTQVKAAFEVRFSHAVDADKLEGLNATRLPGIELLASSLIDATTGEVCWRHTTPLPSPVQSWNIEREGYPFALCERCRELPDTGKLVSAAVPKVESLVMLTKLRSGLVGGDASMGLDCQQLLDAWCKPEALPCLIGTRLARMRGDQLVSPEAQTLAALLNDPFGVALSNAKEGRAVSKEEIDAAEAAWSALTPAAQRDCRDKRRQTHVLLATVRESTKGNTVIKADSLVSRVASKLTEQERRELLKALLKLGRSATPLAGGNGYVGLSSLVRAEHEVLNRVKARVSRSPVRMPLDEGGDEQRQAIAFAFARSFSIVTGGPGTGKTTAVRGLLELISTYDSATGQKDSQRWLLCAPTHKALSRLKQGLSGFGFVDFLTVQYAVGSRFDGRPSSVLVDEASFLDTVLAASLFNKFSQAKQLILVGDPFQLPSVAPGAVLRDLIARFPQSVRSLSVNHRTEGRGLAEAAKAMNKGSPPICSGGEVDVVELDSPASVEQQAMHHYQLLSQGREPGDVQVLAALRKTVGKLNKRLQALQNPTGALLPLHLRVGDRVVVTEVLQPHLAIGLHRGLMGTIHPGESGKLTLRTDNSQSLVVDLDAVTVEPSYAMTVHRAQGSEWPCVLLVLDESHFLTRNLVYTAFTRARSRAVILAPKGFLKRVLERAPSRETSLSSGLL